MQYNNYTPYYLGVFILSILIIAEIFGRRKHIGFWWSFILMLFGGIPGWIAIALSPSAKKMHTQENNIIKNLGIALVVFIVFIGLPVLIATRSSQGLITSFFIYRTSFLLGSCFYGIYLYKLGIGKIRNANPKYYCRLPFRGILEPLSQHTSPAETKVYHVVVDYENSETKIFNFQDLKKSNLINEDTLIWYKGLSSWVRADELNELRDIIFTKPPPLPVKKIQKPKVKNFIELYIESVWREDGGKSFLVVRLLLCLLFLAVFFSTVFYR
jgi:hypothetical protein